MAVDEITGTIISIGPAPPDATPGTIVTFRNERRARLSMLPIAGAHRERLELLWSLNRPAYVLVEKQDPPEPVILNVEIPIVARILDITPIEAGDLVTLDRSAARHVLAVNAPDHHTLRARLQLSLENPELFVVVRRDPLTHDILDVLPAEDRLFTPSPSAPLIPYQPPSRAEVLAALTPMPRAAATAFVVQQKSKNSCGLSGAGPNCVPFRYPDDGCFARANRLCELLEQVQIVAGKIWIFSRVMFAFTSDHPCCRVGWTWHVAAIVKSKETGFPLVLEPVLCDEAVDVDTLLNMLHDPSARHVFTDATAFLPANGGLFLREDPAQPTFNDETEDWLKIYRNELLRRKPPYRCWP